MLKPGFNSFHLSIMLTCIGLSCTIAMVRGIFKTNVKNISGVSITVILIILNTIDSLIWAFSDNTEVLKQLNLNFDIKYVDQDTMFFILFLLMNFFAIASYSCFEIGILRESSMIGRLQRCFVGVVSVGLIAVHIYFYYLYNKIFILILSLL